MLQGVLVLMTETNKPKIVIEPISEGERDLCENNDSHIIHREDCTFVIKLCKECLDEFKK